MSFKGTKFHGWQAQENAVSVQSELENCISLVMKEEIKITGCGRTDTGVHAAFYVAHFDYRSILKTETLNLYVNKLNLFINKSVVIHKILHTDNDFNARFSAVKRTYKYFITHKKNPFINDISLQIKGKLNLKLMELSCKILKNYSDFTSFSKTGGNNYTNICQIYDAKWEYFENNEILVFTITANRFLRNMVRAIVGTMIDVGKEKIDLTQFRNIIESKKRSNASTSIDAKGLFLWNIEYDKKYSKDFSENNHSVLPFNFN